MVGRLEGLSVGFYWHDTRIRHLSRESVALLAVHVVWLRYERGL